MADNKAVSAAKGAGRVVAKQSTPATVILFLALMAGLVGRWAHNKPLPSATGFFQIVFALVVITVLDRGNTRPIARGFAYLFLAVVLLGPDSPLQALTITNKITNNPKNPPKKGQGI